MGTRVITSKPPHYLREWRRARNFSQQELAEKAGITRGLISKLETGCTNYTQETLASISKVFAGSPGALIDLPPGPAARIMTRLASATSREIVAIEKIVDAVLSIRHRSYQLVWREHKPKPTLVD